MSSFNFLRSKSGNKTNNGKNENIATVVSIVGACISGVSLYIVIWSIYKTEEIAQRSGAFDKAELKLSLGDYSILPDQSYEIYYGLTSNDSTLNLVPLPTEIFNSG